MSIHAAFGRLTRIASIVSVGRICEPVLRAIVNAGKQRLRCLQSTNRWLLAVALGCGLLVSCSRSHGVFAGAPLYSGATEQRVSPVVDCIADRWERSTRNLHRSHSGAAVRLQGETFFRGVPIGVKVFRAMGRTRVQFFQERSTDHIYMAFVKGCLQ
jgi:hypothetical protein